MYCTSHSRATGSRMAAGWWLLMRHASCSWWPHAARRSTRSEYVHCSSSVPTTSSASSPTSPPQHRTTNAWESAYGLDGSHTLLAPPRGASVPCDGSTSQGASGGCSATKKSPARLRACRTPARASAPTVVSHRCPGRLKPSLACSRAPPQMPCRRHDPCRANGAMLG